MDCLTESDFPASQRRFLRLNETESCLSETTLGWSVPLGWYLRTSDLPTVHENQRSIEERNSQETPFKREAACPPAARLPARVSRLPPVSFYRPVLGYQADKNPLLYHVHKDKPLFTAREP